MKCNEGRNLFFLLRKNKFIEDSIGINVINSLMIKVLRGNIASLYYQGNYIVLIGALDKLINNQDLKDCSSMIPY